MARILILPSGNTFSHLWECCGIGVKLDAAGHEILYGGAKKYSQWAQEQGLAYEVIPELWEKGPHDHPNVGWFVDSRHVECCVSAEIALIDKLQPDLVVADFKYITGISARATGCRLVTKNILTMLPATRPNYGFLPEEGSAASREQRRNLDFFNQLACRALNQAAEKFGVQPREAVADFLEGEAVIVPDFPAFHGVSQLPAHYRVVKPLWDKSRCLEGHGAEAMPFSRQQPAAGREGAAQGHGIFISLGSSCRYPEALWHVATALGPGPWPLYISTSGNNGSLLAELKNALPKAAIAPYFHISALADQIGTYISQGGLGGVYEAVRLRMSLFIIPQQPEQDHNGRLVEHHGLGARLGPSRPFDGKISGYKESLLSTPQTEIRKKVGAVADSAACRHRAEAWSTLLAQEESTLPEAGQCIDELLR